MVFNTGTHNYSKCRDYMTEEYSALNGMYASHSFPPPISGNTVEDGIGKPARANDQRGLLENNVFCI